MAGLTAKAIGDLAGVTRQAVDRAANEGKLVRIDGTTRFDPTAPVNARWIEHRARRRVDGLGRPLPLPAPIVSVAEHFDGAEEPGSSKFELPPAPRARSQKGIGSDGLFTDWSELAIDKVAADRLLGEVPSDRESQIAFLCLMVEGLRAAVSQALAAQREEHRAAFADLEERLGGVFQAVKMLAGITSPAAETATGAAGAPPAEGLSEPGEGRGGP